MCGGGGGRSVHRLVFVELGAPLVRALAGLALEGAIEGREILEAALEGDAEDGPVGVLEQLLGVIDAQLVVQRLRAHIYLAMNVL